MEERSNQNPPEIKAEIHEEKIITGRGAYKLTRAYKELKRFVKSNLLPAIVASPDGWNIEHQKAMLNHLGFTILKKENTDADGNAYLFSCKFPNGWRKSILAGSNNWCYLYDNKGRKRASIYFKFMTDFVDGESKEAVEEIRRRKFGVASHMNYMCRFRAKVDHAVPYRIHKGNKQGVEHFSSDLVGKVLDSEYKVLYETRHVKMEYDFVKEKAKYVEQEAKVRNELFNECQEWLNKNLPEHDIISAYWDLDDKTLKDIISINRSKEEKDENIS